MKHHWVIIVFLFILGGCAQHETNPIKIGGAFALTGDAAGWGQDEQRAAQLAVDETNALGGIDGRQIMLVSEDTATDSKGTLNAIRKLIDVDHVPAIIGPTWGDSFASITAPIGEENGVVQITPSGAIEVAEETINYTYFFSTYYPLRSEIETHIQFLKAHNYTRVAMIRLTHST